MIDRTRLPRSFRRTLSALLATVLVVALLAACGDDGNEGAQIEWIPGTPPDDVALIDEPTPTEVAPTPDDEPSETTNPTPTGDVAAPTATPIRRWRFSAGG